MTDEISRPAPLILVLEDVEETRDRVEHLLDRDGYRVVCARTEAEALLQVRSARPDLLLVGLEGSDAQVMAAACRARDGAQFGIQTPVIVFSAGSIEEGEELDAGENVHLIHPDNFDHLRDFMKRILALSVSV